MWQLAQQHKTEIFAHVSDVLLCGAVLAASVLSFRHRDVLWGPWIGILASLLLLAGAVILFFLNVGAAERALKMKFPGVGRWGLLLMALLYAIPMAQLFLIVAIGSNA